MSGYLGITCPCARFLLILLLVCALPAGTRAELLINEVQASNLDSFADEDGAFEDWIEILNTGPATLDLAGYGLSDDLQDPMLWIFPPRSLAPGERLIVFASGKDRLGAELHANFSLKSAGEAILLSSPSAVPLDLFLAQYLPMGISGGRSPDGGASGFIFDPPTPDAPNDGTGYTGIAAPPAIDPPGGFHSGGVTATISDPGGQAESITWTAGGWEPGADSTLYTAPIGISTTTILRARSFETGKLPSPIITRSYLVGEEMTLPSVSIVTDPDNLWDHDTGIYVLGDGDPSYPYDGANFWMNWERPAHAEAFASDGSPVYDLDFGLKIHGNMSRTKPQKSLRLMMRQGYGAGEIAQPLFAEQGNDLADFERLILRNASNDWCLAHLRDGYAQNVVRHLDLDAQGFIPHVVYLNGEYWGIQHLREYMDEYYIQDHHGVNRGNMDILEGQGTAYDIFHGDNTEYRNLVLYFETNGLADQGNYDYVASQIEVDNFATYNIIEIFFGNMDWPRNNRRYWKSRAPGSRWRWMIIDLDFSLGIFEDAGYDNLAYATAEAGGSQNPPWATLMLRRLLENEGFRADFINRYLDHLNGTFATGRLLDQLQEVTDLLDPEIGRHQERWDRSYLGWQLAVQDIQEFVTDRPTQARQHLVNMFGLGDTLSLTLNTEPTAMGSIHLTALSTDSLWTGLYHQGNPIALRAEATPGWSFDYWSSGETTAEILIDPVSATSLTAHFSPSQAPQPRIVMNEINYNSTLDFNVGDWVEFYNSGMGVVDLSGWEFRDENDVHVYAFATGTQIAPGDYLLLCEDRTTFMELFPGTDPLPGNTGFGFSGGGELLRLFDDFGLLHDSVEYNDVAPWPPEADGNGPTLELIHFARDNALAENWAASTVPAPHGTPGAQNSVFDATALPGPPPPAMALAAPYPNPFNPSTRLSFQLTAAGPVRLSIHDIRGRELLRLVDEPLASGRHSFDWRARDADGRELPAGVYLLRLQAAGILQSRKMVLLK